MTEQRKPSSVIQSDPSAPNELQDIISRLGKRFGGHIEPQLSLEPSSKETTTAPPPGTSLTDEVFSSAPEVLIGLDIPDYIRAEMFLEYLGLFTPSSKRIRGIFTKRKKLGEKTDPDGTKRIIVVEINANHKYGLPITSDLDYYRAFLKILDEAMDQTNRPHLPIAVPTKTLLRYAGKWPSAREQREVRNWFRRMNATLIEGAVYQAKINGYREGFSGTVFSQVVIKGEQRRNGKEAETNYVWPSPWFLSNYIRGYTRRIDLNFHLHLRKPIAKSLYPLLETGWYASGGKPYAKSYNALCEEFLLTKHREPYYVKQQLDPAHKELKAAGFLAKYEYKRSAAGDDWTIVYWPGEKFFKDQEARENRIDLQERIDTKQLKREAPKLLAIPSDGEILTEILSVCGDPQNKGAYVTALKKYPEHILRMALSETRQAANEGRIRKSKGAFFMDILKRLSNA